jgi:hypothetical protein
MDYETPGQSPTDPNIPISEGGCGPEPGTQGNPTLGGGSGDEPTPPPVEEGGNGGG